jgi:hypothetical protein
MNLLIIKLDSIEMSRVFHVPAALTPVNIG